MASRLRITLSPGPAAILCYVLSLAAPALAPSAAPAQSGAILRVRLPAVPEQLGAQLVERALSAASRTGAVAIVVELDSGALSLDVGREVAAIVQRAPLPVYAYAKAPLGRPAWLVFLAADEGFATARVQSAHPAVADSAQGKAVHDEIVALLRQRGADTALATAIMGNWTRVADPARRPAGEPVSLPDLGLGRRAESLDHMLQTLGLPTDRLVTVDERWLGLTVVIENRSWLDVRIYLVRGGQRLRLGAVTSMRRSTFHVAAAQLAEGRRVRLRAEFVGSSDQLTTQPVAHHPGLVLEWRLENVLPQSAFSYWIR